MSALYQQLERTEADLAAARAEIERLTKERDDERAEHLDTLELLDRAEAERDEAQAQVAMAYEVAANTAFNADIRAQGHHGLALEIRTLTPADAQAKLAAIRAEERAAVWRRAVGLTVGHMTGDGARKAILAAMEKEQGE